MAVQGILINGVTEILKSLVPVVAQEISLAWGVKDELKKLQNTFEMILAVIADAERRQPTEEAVRLWLRRLKDVAYDADDVMDEFSYDTLRRRGDRFKHKVLDFVSSSKPLAFYFKMARKIKGVNKKLDEITKDMDRFQLRIIPSGTTDVRGESSERRSRQSTSFASQSQIVGREDDKDRLIKVLTTVIASSSTSLSNIDHRFEKIPVVSIVGMGGLGKTTLAQLIYNDDSVKKHFETKIWVCISDEFDVYKVLSDIMEFITEKKFSDLSNSDVLVRKVREQLTGKRYLLVLDDLWNEDAAQWEKLLESSLNVGAKGSKILITTRKKQVANAVGSVSPYFLEKLEEGECWSIMKTKAFAPCGAVETPNMINIGKEIANKCGGLPLAAKFLGSLMHRRNEEIDWLSIKENDIWKTPESQRQILQLLKLSYDNLSPHLQRCFSYCSIFPKDLELSKQTLIHLWMAEGFLQTANTECSFEDIGDEYFESLMWSSFFEGVKKNYLDDVMTFKVHDLVHDFAQGVVGDHECSTVKVTDLLGINSEVCRLNLIMDDDLLARKSVNNIKKLRTLIILEPKYILNLLGFSSSKHLRVLHLCRTTEGSPGIGYSTSKLRQLRYFHFPPLYLSGNLLDDCSFSRLYNLQTLVLSGCDPVQNRVKEMGSLIHLRNLDISSTDIQELPDSVTSLHNLQRLDLNHCRYFTTFPDFVTGLEFLRFLDISFTLIEKIPNFVTSLEHLQTLDVNTCKNLKALPEKVSGLRNLRIFDFKNCPLLDALPKDFGDLHQLRSLDLSGTEISVLPESCTKLYNLEYVNLWRWCESQKEVTNWIKLRKFYHKGRPMGIGTLILLQELFYQVPEKVITGSESNDGIEELANLNSLEILSIRHLQNVKDPIDAERVNLKGKQNLRVLFLNWNEIEEEMIWDQKSCNFQVFEALQPPSGLKRLCIYNFMGWDLPTWMCVPSCLPNLESLRLHNCKTIKQLPEAIGQLPRLRKLDLKGMSLKSLDIDGFPSLLELGLTNMFLLEELGYSYPPCLQTLKITGCKSLTEIPSFPFLTTLELKMIDPKLVCSVGRSLTSLTFLSLEYIEDLVYFQISILQNSCNLHTLRIIGCNQFEGFRVNDDENGDKVAPLGPDIYSISLQTLVFNDCPVLKFLPDLRRWTSLQKLLIFDCPQVKESLTYDLKSLSFLKALYVDFIQRDELRGDPSVGIVNLLE